VPLKSEVLFTNAFASLPFSRVEAICPVVLHHNGFSKKIQTLKYFLSSTIDLCPVPDVMTGSPHFTTDSHENIKIWPGTGVWQEGHARLNNRRHTKGNEKRKLFLHS
jgi:hypothetical protein